MAFSNSLPNGRLIALRDSGVFSRLGRSLPPSEFSRSFGLGTGPSVIGINPNFNFSLSLGMKGSSRSDDGVPPSSSKKKSGSRPYRGSSYVPPVTRPNTNLSFSSGIPSGLVVNSSEASTSKYSTVFISSGSFLPRSINSSYARQQMDDILFNKILTECQTGVNYRIDSDLDSDSFYNYISALVAGLQLYYQIDSIAAYCAQSDNNNLGMFGLRTRISADVISDHAMLGECLVRQPIPKNLLDTIRYMYQNFMFSEDPDSPIIRLGFRDTLHNGDYDNMSSDYFRTIIQEINNTGKRIGPILMKTFPHLKLSSLPYSSAVPIYDKNFCSFWINNSVSYLASGKDELSHTRTVRDLTEEFNLFTLNGDKIDGLIMSCHSLFNHDSQSYESGLWVPFSDLTRFKFMNDDCRSSLICYDHSLGQFVTPQSLGTLSQSGYYHGVYRNSKDGKFNDCIMPPIGSVKFQTCSLKMFAQSVSLSVRYLFQL